MRSRRRTRRLAAALAGVGLALAAGAAEMAGARTGPAPAPAAAPVVKAVVLGTAQDGGVPQAGCDCARCAAARRVPARRRWVASLGLWVPGRRRLYLVDATPNLGEQLGVLRHLEPRAPGRQDRRPVDGVLLTHAHIGHYLGLAFFGFEAIDSRGLPVWASARMGDFLRRNGPWSLLVARRNVELRTLTPGTPVELEPGLEVTPLVVPHRDELSDTLGFVVRGPRHRLLYVPDTDGWAAWKVPLPQLLARERIDVALLDGTFHDPAELPDRDVRQIGHPLMTATAALLGDAVRAGRLRMWFTHLNHSNPVLDPASPERRALLAAGFGVAEDGQVIDL